MLNSEGTNFLFVLNLLEDPMDSTGIFFFNEEGGAAIRYTFLLLCQVWGRGHWQKCVSPTIPRHSAPLPPAVVG